MENRLPLALFASEFTTQDSSVDLEMLLSEMYPLSGLHQPSSTDSGVDISTPLLHDTLASPAALVDNHQIQSELVSTFINILHVLISLPHKTLSSTN